MNIIIIIGTKDTHVPVLRSVELCSVVLNCADLLFYVALYCAMSWCVVHRCAEPSLVVIRFELKCVMLGLCTLLCFVVCPEAVWMVLFLCAVQFSFCFCAVPSCSCCVSRSAFVVLWCTGVLCNVTSFYLGVMCFVVLMHCVLGVSQWRFLLSGIEGTSLLCWSTASAAFSPWTVEYPSLSSVVEASSWSVQYVAPEHTSSKSAHPGTVCKGQAYTTHGTHQTTTKTKIITQKDITQFNKTHTTHDPCK